MDDLTVKFGEEQKQRLAPKMPQKDINIVVDETFHRSVPCLVGMEAKSNFILAEEYAEKRTGESWNNVMVPALKGLKVKVIWGGADGAPGIKNHVEQCLGARVAPDIFHITYDISKGMGATLAARIRQAEKAHEMAKQETRGCVVEKERYKKSCMEDSDNVIVGHDAELQEIIEESKEAETQAEKQVSVALQSQIDYRKALKNISKAYHPCSLETGEPKTPESLGKELKQRYDEIEEIAGASDVSENGNKLIDKSRRSIGDLTAVLTYFWVYVTAQLLGAGIEVTSALELFMKDKLIPALYWMSAARKVRKAAERKKMQQESEEHFKKVLADPLWQGLSEADRKEMMQIGERCAGMFIRSTSCVEGHNGQLSLRHHSYHRLRGRKLKSVTVIHNYYIRNKKKNNKTPAELFFEQEHDDLFEYLLKNMPSPAWPRNKQWGGVRQAA